MQTPKFLARINDSKEYEIFQRFLKTHRIWMDRFKPGDVVSVVIKKDSVKKIRSLKANNYYWGVVVGYCCEAFGYEKHEADMVHEGLKMKFLSEEKIVGFPVPKSTANLKSDEFWDYIETIKRYMTQEYRVYIPDPNEIEKVIDVEFTVVNQQVETRKLIDS